MFKKYFQELISGIILFLQTEINLSHSECILRSREILTTLKWYSVQFSHSVMSDSLQPYGLQHSRPPCPPPTPGVYSDSCPLSQWCHPTFSSSVIPFSSRLQSFPASGSLLMSQFFTSGRWTKYWNFIFSISPSERLLLNHTKTWRFLASRGEEFNLGPGTRFDRSEFLCNKVLLKCKGDRESFWHRHQKGVETVPLC